MYLNYLCNFVLTLDRDVNKELFTLDIKVQNYFHGNHRIIILDRKIKTAFQTHFNYISDVKKKKEKTFNL